ncbi:MAG: hypothetical protein CXT77_04705 [uncultured DHVE6 group euryarchaeote]|jgi:hypothetical protein|nr:MAG: hypothetical protein CXT77_04705 [uncultured DHVE6 group euryarchaeote]
MAKSGLRAPSYLRRVIGYWLDRVWILTIGLGIYLQMESQRYYPRVGEIIKTDYTFMNTLLIVFIISVVVLMFFIKRVNATPGMWFASLRFVPTEHKGKVNPIVLSILVTILIVIKYVSYINLIPLLNNKNKDKQTILNYIANVKVQEVIKYRYR